MDNKYIQTGDIGLLIPNKEIIDKSFMYYLVSSDIIKKQLSNGAQQTKIRHTSPDKIKDCVAWIPKLNLQKKIGKFFDVINRKIEVNNSINDKLQEIAKTLYDYWFTQFDFPDKNGKPYKSSGGKMVYNEQLKREIPEGWEVCSINKYTDIYQPQTISNNLFDNSAPYNVYGGGGFIGKYFQYNHEDSEVIISCRGNCGNFYFTSPKSWITGNAMVVSPKNSILNKYYLYLFLNRYGVEKYLSGSVQKQLTRENLSLMPIYIPSADSLEKFNNLIKPIFEKIINIRLEIEKLTKLRDFLLPMLMNGQATVCDSVVTMPIKESVIANETIIKNESFYNQRFDMWLSSCGVAARGDIDKATLREIFDAMDEDDK